MAFEGFLKLCLSVLVLCVVSAESSGNIIRFDTDEINEIVKAHNDLRRSIYNAANMRELTWNEGVAMAASEWGTECEYVSRPDNHWGQNMNYFSGSDYHNPAIDLFKDSFSTWANATIHYDYRRFRFCGRKNVCSYVQLIAADVEQVGCAVVKCPRLQLKDPYEIQTHAKMLICFYTPWVDISNKEVFIPEERCGACPPGTVCVDNLCSARFAGSEPHKLESIGKPKIDIGISSISGKRFDSSERRGKHGERSSGGQDRRTDTTIGQNKNDKSPNGVSSDVAYAEHRRNPDAFISNRATEDHVVIYTPNNRVVPFPGKKESKDIRRIEKYERKLEKRKQKEEKKRNTQKKQKKQNDQGDLGQMIEKVVTNKKQTNATQTPLSRNKRQTSYEDALYLRRLEYERYLRHLREREARDRERRRRHEEDLRRRRDHHRRQLVMAELRRASDDQRRAQQLMELRRVSDDERRIEEERERRRRRRLREQRRRLELMALLQSEGELTGEEQFNTISAHNILRRQDGARELSWSSHLEKWAKYVIRCETEYPGPITCHTNFGKTNAGQEIYNVVYEWGAEGDDLRRPLRYGCRTPYDQSLCNHNSVLRDSSLTQMACAAKNCGLQRQLTCLYNSGS